MNRHALYLMLAAAALLCSCQSGRVRIEGRIVGADHPPGYIETITPPAPAGGIFTFREKYCW